MQDIPQHRYRPVLSHIESIQIGIPPRIRRRSSPRKNKRKSFKSKFDSSLDSKQEHEYFKQLASSSLKKKRRNFVKEEDSNDSDGDTVDNRNNRLMNVLLPLPFGLPTKKKNSIVIDDSNDSGKIFRVHRLPVKVIGTSCVTYHEDDNNNQYNDSNQKDNIIENDDFSYDDDDEGHNVKSIETTEKKIKEITFPRSTKGLPEVAVIGRSNVGKSTLVNALLYNESVSQTPSKEGKHDTDGKDTPPETPFTRGRRGRAYVKPLPLPKGIKAKTSSRPGETQHITFYQLTSHLFSSDKNSFDEICTKKSLLFLDLPGYGFAFASPIKNKEMQETMKAFFSTERPSLKRILLLLDARHGFKTADVDFLLEIQQNMRLPRKIPPIQIVLTKCDLVPQVELAKRSVQVRDELKTILKRETSAGLPVMLTTTKSTQKNIMTKVNEAGNIVNMNPAFVGIQELQSELASLVSGMKSKF